jgi:hypothetical protein
MTADAGRTSSPFDGLRPFHEEDRPFFFGREREIRVISSSNMFPDSSS